MTLLLPIDDIPSSPQVILAFVAEQLPHADAAAIARVEDRLHDRLRILREREQPCDPIRDALALCALRRQELAADGGEGAPGASRAFPMGEH